VLRKHGELAHRGRTKARKTYPAPTTHHATSPNQVSSWDCTWLPRPAKRTYYYLIMILDIFSRKVVGWEVFLAESAENSYTVIERAVLSEKIVNQPLVLHSDNGSSFKGVTLLEKLRDLQIAPSFSRPRVSNDSAFSEALFKTCKYVPGYPASGFTGLTEARQWVHSFAQWYNYTHRDSALRYATPAQRHSLNQAARAAKPERWSGNTRNWIPATVVTLNPERKEALVAMEVAA
jgi:putative transposase